MPTITHNLSELDDPNHPYFRYAHDDWYFGMLLTTGDIIAFEKIEELKHEYVVIRAVSEDALTSLSRPHAFFRECVGCPTARSRILVNRSQIVSIFELMDS